MQGRNLPRIRRLPPPLPALSLTSASRSIPVSRVEDIPIVSRAAQSLRYCVRWGKEERDTDGGDVDDDTEEFEASDKAALHLPSVTLLPAASSVSPASSSSRPPAISSFPVLHSVAAHPGARPSLSKRSRQVAFTSYDFSSSQRAALSKRTATRGAVTARSSVELQPRPLLAFSLYQQHVHSTEQQQHEEQREALPSPPQPRSSHHLASPQFSPFASPPLTPYLSPSVAPQPAPLLVPSSPLTQSSPAWVDFLQWRALSSRDPGKAGRLVYVLQQMRREALLPSSKDALLSFIARYVEDSAWFESPLLFIQHAYDELTLLASTASPSGLAINSLLTFLSFDLVMHLVRPASACLPAAASARCASVWESLLSIVLTHAFAHHEHFPSAPFYLQRRGIDTSYHALQAEHARGLHTRRGKAETHRAECERWQKGVRRVRESWKRTVQAVTLIAWRRHTAMTRWRRGVEGDDKKGAEARESGLVRGLRRLRERGERRVQLRSAFIAWRSSSLAARVSALRFEHTALRTAHPHQEAELSANQARHAALVEAHTQQAAVLEEQRSHLSIMHSQIADYVAQREEVEGSVEEVRLLLCQWWDLLSVLREEMELQAVQLVMAGQQGPGGAARRRRRRTHRRSGRREGPVGRPHSAVEAAVTERGGRVRVAARWDGAGRVEASAGAVRRLPAPVDGRADGVCAESERPGGRRRSAVHVTDAVVAHGPHGSAAARCVSHRHPQPRVVCRVDAVRAQDAAVHALPEGRGHGQRSAEGRRPHLRAHPTATARRPPHGFRPDGRIVGAANHPSRPWDDVLDHTAVVAGGV